MSPKLAKMLMVNAILDDRFLINYICLQKPNITINCKLDLIKNQCSQNECSDTYWLRQKQPMQMTVTQIITAAAAMITITTNTANKNKITLL